AEAARHVRPAVVERLADRLAGDELLAHQAHGQVDAGPDQRLAAPGDQAGQRRRQPALAVRRGPPAGQPQAPRPRRGEPPQAAAWTNRDGPLPRCPSQSPPPILSRISASRVSSSGIRSKASARHISATPSSLAREYSRISPSTPCPGPLARSRSTSRRASA